jgi:hypothetical protein
MVSPRYRRHILPSRYPLVISLYFCSPRSFRSRPFQRSPGLETSSLAFPYRPITSLTTYSSSDALTTVASFFRCTPESFLTLRTHPDLSLSHPTRRTAPPVPSLARDHSGYCRTVYHVTLLPFLAPLTSCSCLVWAFPPSFGHVFASCCSSLSCLHVRPMAILP